MNKHVKRAIKQADDFWSKQEEGFISWDKVADDFESGETKVMMMAKWGFTSFQYKILKKYMVGN